MMSLDEKIFGHMPDGAPVRIYWLKNRNGVVVKVAEYGAIITEIHAPDRDGKDGDVVLGGAIDKVEHPLRQAALCCCAQIVDVEAAIECSHQTVSMTMSRSRLP